jgi:NADP-dependent 3-hydroxy acid dehydrogenase YdfG
MVDGGRAGKVVLVTGASAGFGEMAARKLLERGHTVYAAARRVERMAGLEELGATPLAMDVTQDASVAAGVERLLAEQGRVDALVANAGYGSYGAIEAIPLDEIRYQYEVNVFGVARTVKAVLPSMRARRSGRIVISASVVSNFSMACAGWYCSTKHAVKGMAEALRQETRDLGIEVVLIEPGAVKTEFDEVAFAALDRVEHPEDYQRLLRGFRKALALSYASAPGPEETAEAIAEAAVTAKPKTRYRTTRSARIMPRLRALLSDRRFDSMMLAQLYKAADQE